MAVKRRLPGVEEPNAEIVTRPVSTYARPEAPALPPDSPARTDLLRLAQSLSGSSEALADYARTYTRATAETGVNNAMGLNLSETNREISRRLTQPGGVPADVNRRALEIGHGENLARGFFGDMRQRYLGQSTAPQGQPSNAFDRNSGDIDAWFKQLMQEREGTLPPGEGVRFGWNRMMQGFQERLYAEHDQYLQQRTLQANLDAAHSAMYGIATEAIAGGERDPRAIHRRMQEALPRIQQMHLLTPQQANAAAFSAARSIAEQGIPGNPQLGLDLAREMLLGERTGANGQRLPALGTSNEYAHLTNQVIEAAEKRAAELQRPLERETIVRFRDDALNGRLDEEAATKFFADNPHVLGAGTQGHLENLLVQNRNAADKAREAQQRLADDIARRARSQASEDELNEFLRRRGDDGTLQGTPERMTVLKPNGEPHELRREALLDRARDNELARIAEWGRQQAAIENEVMDAGAPRTGPSVEDRVFQRTFEFLNRNGLKNPEWEGTLAGGYAAATPQAVAAAQPPPLLSQAVQLYENLEAKSPGMLERHLQTQSARDFYRVYRIARTSLRQDERQAMVTAMSATADIGADDSKAPSLKKLDEQIRAMGSILPWVESITNAGDLRNDISRLSRFLVRTGMAPDAALKLAGEDVRSQYTNINGFMVKTGDRAIEVYGAMLGAAQLQPRTFEESVRKYLEAYARENPAAVDATTYDPTGGLPPQGEAAVAAPLMTSAARRLSIRPRPNATGAWAIIDAATGLPVPSGPGGMRQTIGLRDLLAFEQRSQAEEQDREAQRLADIVRKAQERDEERARNAPPIPFAVQDDPAPTTATGGTILDLLPHQDRRGDWPDPEEFLDTMMPDIRMREPERRPPQLGDEWWRGAWGTPAEEWGYPRERKPELPNPPRRTRRRRSSEEWAP